MTGLVLAAVIAGASSAPAPGEAWIVRRDGKHLLVSATQEVEVPGPELRWAPKGRRLAVFTPAGSLVAVLVSGLTATPIADRVDGVAWAPDGAKLAFWTGPTLRATNTSIPSGSAVELAKDAVPGSAAWSPNSDRVVFSNDAHLWIVGADGTNRRRLVRDRAAICTAWSPDGRTIAFVQPGLGTAPSSLLTIRPSGTGTRRIGPLRATSLEWSPNGKWLLAANGSDWSVVDSANGKATPLALDPRSRPFWVGASKLQILREGRLATVMAADPTTATSTREVTLPAEVVAYGTTPMLELTNELAQRGLPAEARAPGFGRMALHGVIEEAEPITGRYRVAVDTVIDGRAWERRYATPISQPVLLDDRTVNMANQQALRSIDLRLDMEVTLLVEGGALDANTPLTIRGGWLEDEPDWVAPPLRSGPRLRGDPLDYDGVSRERVVVPLVFPVVGKSNWSDWFLAPRGGGTRRHHGQDIMAAKMTPMVACFDGVVFVGRSSRVGGHNTITIRGDNGWIANYYHVNNDTPGTDDGLGTDQYAFAPGLESGQRVFAGQFIGYVGDSGNAENTPPHLHFELWDSVTRAVINPADSLRAAQRIPTPLGRRIAGAIPLRKGESRFDGVLESVDRTRNVLRTRLFSRTVNGKTVAVTRSQRVYARIQPKTEIHLLGNENLPLKLDDLRPGLYVVLVGPPGKPGAAITPRQAAFAPQ